MSKHIRRHHLSTLSTSLERGTGPTVEASEHRSAPPAPLRRTVRGLALGSVALSATLVLAGCGSDADPDDGSGGDGSASSSASANAHNKADVAFATEMIRHHRQAVRMAGMAPDKAGSSDVKELAEKIEKAQGPEITKMSGWLKAWGETVPPKDSGMDHGGGSGDGDEDRSGDSDGHGGHGGGSDEGAAESGMPGMLTGKQLRELEKSSGGKFDQKFLTMMIEHHEGAVTMARTEREKGANSAAKQLAKEVITAQNDEIKQMHRMLGH